MKLPIDDEVMRKQPGVIAATTPAGGMAPLPAHVPSAPVPRVRRESSGPAASSAAMDVPSADIQTSSSSSEHVVDAGDDIQREIEKELADS
jgi:hypothetical protein